MRGVGIVSVSSFYASPAWPDPSDPPYVNAVARVETAKTPIELLETLHEVEKSFGRVRTVPNAPRPLDIDLIDYDGRIEAGPPVLPHPRLAARAFVLVPLADVAPQWKHPQSGLSVGELVAALPDAARAVVRL